LKEGSYFGEVSYIFKLKNKIMFIPRKSSTFSLFSLKTLYLENIFEAYPDFMNMLTIRGLRRYRYWKKLKFQLRKMTLTKFKYGSFIV